MRSTNIGEATFVACLNEHRQREAAALIGILNRVCAGRGFPTGVRSACADSNVIVLRRVLLIPSVKRE